MINALFATAIIFVLLLVSEQLWNDKQIRGEYARKFVHVIAGTFIAFLPFWISYGWVALLALGFLAANLLNRFTKLFHAINTITRKSWGELLFGVGILFAALLRPNKWMFAGAILQVAIADGFAALIGTRYGKNTYKLYGHTKSPIGTTTFYVASLLITFLTIHYGGGAVATHKLASLIVVPLTLAVVENLSGYGTDNVTLPMGFLVLLTVLNG